MGKDTLEKKDKKFFGYIDEIIIDSEGNEFVPHKAEPQETKQEVKQEEPKKEIIEEPVVEEVEEVAEESIEEAVTETAEAPVVEELPIVDDKPKFIAKTFAQKMLEADEVIQDRYDELKNYALRFKKLKARISRKFDSINKGRLQFVKLSVAGKTLKLYLNMDIDATDSKFHCKDMRDKKTYVTVPVLLRIKSGRAVKYAKILIDQCAEFHGLLENKKFEEVDAIALVEEAINSKDDGDESVEVAVTSEE